MRTIYLDVSDTVRMRLNSGIQRVVRRIVTEGEAIAHEFGVQVVPVVLLGDRIVRLNPAGSDVLHTPEEPIVGLGVNELVKGYSGLKGFLKSFPGPYRYIRRKALERRHFGALIGTTVRPAAGDSVVLLDAFWNVDTSVSTAKRMRRRRIATVGVIYDMIPVTNPEMFDGELAGLYAARLTELITLGIRFIAISQDAARKALDYARPHGYVGDIGTFYLGFDLPGAKATPAPAADAWPAPLWAGSGPLHLMVGTVEPRKGIDVAVDAMDRLWAAGHNHRLLVIGRVGWLADELLKRVREHPQFGRRLFMVHGADDAMLAQAYQRADDCLVASRSEGFGLPLVEALSVGLPVIASDIDVFREIAPDVPLFFRSGDGQDLARVLLQMQAERAERRAMAQAFHWIDWRESARQFLRGVIALADEPAATAAGKVRPPMTGAPT